MNVLQQVGILEWQVGCLEWLAAVFLTSLVPSPQKPEVVSGQKPRVGPGLVLPEPFERYNKSQTLHGTGIYICTNQLGWSKKGVT